VYNINLQLSIKLPIEVIYFRNSLFTLKWVDGYNINENSGSRINNNQCGTFSLFGNLNGNKFQFVRLEFRTEFRNVLLISYVSKNKLDHLQIRDIKF